MTTAHDVEAALAKLRAARFQLFLVGQQRNDAVLREAQHHESINSLNEKIANARKDVQLATDELLLAMVEEPSPK
jgi:hypothetical protein